jgi:hypothetical protein
VQSKFKPETIQTQIPFFEEPSGAKGIVSLINRENNTIKLKDARFFDPALNRFVTSDLLVWTNDSTTFFTNLVEEGNFDSIVQGSMIICNGPIDFQHKEIKFASDLYIGEFVHDDAKKLIHFSCPIQNYNPDLKSFDIDYPSKSGNILTIHVIINENTQITSILKSSPKTPTKPISGLIPAFVKEKTFMRGSFIVNRDLTAVANLITFFEN